MKLLHLELGSLRCNNYILCNEESGAGVLIDCSGSGEEIVLEAKKHGVSISAILLTHGHIDHIEGVDRVVAEFGCPVYLHAWDLEYLSRPGYNLSERVYGRSMTVQTSAHPLRDGDELQLAGFEFKVLHTPGHTDGSVCYRCGELLFTGDTLFYESVGADLPPFGNLRTEVQSIQNTLFTIGEDLICYPGHGDKTSLAYEMKNNMYCRN